MHNGIAFLQDVRRLIVEDSFVLTIFAVVAVATVLAFGFGAAADTVASVLILGVMTAFAERKLHEKK